MLWPLGRYCQISPLVFSLVPRSHETRRLPYPRRCRTRAMHGRAEQQTVTATSCVGLAYNSSVFSTARSTSP